MKRLICLVAIMASMLALFSSSVLSEEVKTPVLKAGAKKPDDLQKSYIEQLKDNTKTTLAAYQEKASCARKLAYQDKLDLLDIQYQGRVKFDNKIERSKLEGTDEGLKIRIQRLEGAREDLKLDAMKYYKGKLPIWLYNEWTTVEFQYLDAVNKVLQDSLKEVQTIRAEK